MLSFNNTTSFGNFNQQWFGNNVFKFMISLAEFVQRDRRSASMFFTPATCVTVN